MARKQKTRYLAFTLVPLKYMKNQEFCWKSAKIIKNLKFAIWKKKLLNFLGLPRLNRDKSALFFFYWTTTDQLEFTGWSQVNEMNSCEENSIFQRRMMIALPPVLTRVKTSHQWKHKDLDERLTCRLYWQLRWWLVSFTFSAHLFKLMITIGTSVRRSSGRCSGGRLLAMM